MHWLLDLAILWFGLNIVIMATSWYVARVMPLFWPEWWRHVVVDIEPDYYRAPK